MNNSLEQGSVISRSVIVDLLKALFWGAGVFFIVFGFAAAMQGELIWFAVVYSGLLLFCGAAIARTFYARRVEKLEKRLAIFKRFPGLPSETVAVAPPRNVVLMPKRNIRGAQ